MSGDVKQFVHEFCQKNGQVPSYEYTSSGVKHRLRFTCEVPAEMMSIISKESLINPISKHDILHFLSV